MVVIWQVHSTFPNKSEAISVASQLLEKRLIACANIVPGMVSLYRWNGAMEQGEEVLLMAKTQESQVNAVISAINSLHSYELPTIVAFEMGRGHLPFFQWVESEASGAIRDILPDGLR